MNPNDPLNPLRQMWDEGTRRVGDSLVGRAVSKTSSLMGSAAGAVKDGLVATKQWAAEKVIAGETAAIDKTTAWLLSDKTRRDNLLASSKSQRANFSAATCVECGNPNTTHPDKRDGQFMGKDCPATQAGKPEQGVMPSGCNQAKNGKMVFTNGINNDAEKVCKTMKALADSRCMEVTGVFNATYADSSLKKTKGPDTPGNPLAKAAGNVGLVQDVLDCVDTISGTATDAAAATLGQEIARSLAAGQPMTVYAHSQGGLNAGRAVEIAKEELVDAEQKKLMLIGMPEGPAHSKATQLVEQQMAKQLSVHTFGTLERGLTDGPRYVRITNELDPVPKIIRRAQDAMSPADKKELLQRDPSGSPPVDRFRAAPSAVDAMAAHGMQESYIPYLDQAHPCGPCC